MRSSTSAIYLENLIQSKNIQNYRVFRRISSSFRNNLTNFSWFAIFIIYKGLLRCQTEGFLSSVFRKTPFTGRYFRWDSFGPTKRKTKLIETLVHRALMICSKSKLQHELENISSILRNSGYQESIIQITMSKKIALFNCKPKEEIRKSVQFT